MSVTEWGDNKMHKFILNSLQFSESFQKHTVIWIFFQLVLTRHEKKKKKEKKRKKCENSHNSLFKCSLKKVLCSTNFSTLSYCSYVQRFWLRDLWYVICLWLAEHSTVRCLSLAEEPLVKRLWLAGCKWLAELFPKRHCRLADRLPALRLWLAEHCTSLLANPL